MISHQGFGKKNRGDIQEGTYIYMTCNLYRKQSYSLLYKNTAGACLCVDVCILLDFLLDFYWIIIWIILLDFFLDILLDFFGYFAVITWRLVLWSEKGELKKHVTMLMTVSVT